MKDLSKTEKRRLTVQKCQCNNEQNVEEKRKPEKRPNANPIPMFIRIVPSRLKQDFPDCVVKSMNQVRLQVQKVIRNSLELQSWLKAKNN